MRQRGPEGEMSGAGLECLCWVIQAPGCPGATVQQDKETAAEAKGCRDSADLLPASYAGWRLPVEDASWGFGDDMC